MKQVITKQFIDSLGVSIDAEHHALLEQHFEETLDDRIIKELVHELTDDQLEELALLRQSSTDDVQRWLAANVPDLEEIIEEEMQLLIAELIENKDSL